MIDIDHTYFTDQPLEQKLSRIVTTLKKKVNHLQKELLEALKEKSLITDEHLINLSENYDDVAKSFFKNQIESSRKVALMLNTITLRQSSLLGHYTTIHLKHMILSRRL